MSGATPARRPWIVVFGAAVRPGGRPSGVLRRRIQGAVAAAGRLPDAGLVATGGRGRHGPAEAVVIRDHLLAAGVAPERVLLEPTGRDTLESALACAAILRRRPDVGRVHVCTSWFHRGRCRLLLALLGFATASVPLPPAPPGRPSLKLLLWILKEPLVLPWDALLALRHRVAGRPR